MEQIINEMIISKEIEIDCSKIFGTEMFTFYQPITIGDFVVSIWTKSMPSFEYIKNKYDENVVENNSLSSKYSIIIYENGKKIVNFKDDRRFENFPCQKEFLKSWCGIIIKSFI